MQGSRFVTGAALALALLVPSTALGARHVYVSNSTSPSSANVSAFTLAPNGVLQPNGASAGSGDPNAEAVVFAPDGAHLYVAGDSIPATVSTLPVAADGTLASGTTIPAGSSGANFMAMAPDGKHLYVQTGATISVLSVSSNGSLAPQGSGVAAGSAPQGVAVAPGGGSLYVADFGGPAGSILRYSIDSNGSLTPQGSTPSGGDGAEQISITPSGRSLYVTNVNSQTVSAFSLNPANGALSPVGSPFPTGSADSPDGIAVTPDGAHLYVANGEHSTSAFAIDSSSGALSPVAGSPFSVGSDPGSAALAVSPDGQQLLESLFTSSKLNASSIASSGALSQISTIASGGTGPDSQAVVPRPNQPATAAFSAKPLKSGRVHFNGNASKDPDGKVATYRWDFGDGTPLTDVQKAGTDHTYALAGKYTATLETIDNEGCSTTLVFSGQSALCNGSGAADAKKSFNSSVQFTLSARKRQRTRVLRATGLCPTEACNVQLGGSVKVGSKKLKLRRTRRSLAAATPRTWRMRLPRRALRALKKLPRSKFLNVRISAAARAASGSGRNTSRQLTIKLRGRHRR